MSLKLGLDHHRAVRFTVRNVQEEHQNHEYTFKDMTETRVPALQYCNFQQLFMREIGCRVHTDHYTKKRLTSLLQPSPQPRPKILRIWSTAAIPAAIAIRHNQRRNCVPPPNSQHTNNHLRHSNPARVSWRMRRITQS